MDKLFEKIAQESFKDELQKLSYFSRFNNTLTGSFLEDDEEDDGLGFVAPMMGGTIGGAVAGGGLGMLRNLILGIPDYSRNIKSDSIAGALIGGFGMGAKLILDHFTQQESPIGE